MERNYVLEANGLYICRCVRRSHLYVPTCDVDEMKRQDNRKEAEICVVDKHHVSVIVQAAAASFITASITKWEIITNSNLISHEPVLGAGADIITL